MNNVASIPVVTKKLGIVTFFRTELELNAANAINVTEFGIVIDVILELPKDNLGMVVTVYITSSIVTDGKIVTDPVAPAFVTCTSVALIVV